MKKTALLLLVLLSLSCLPACKKTPSGRTTVSLNGVWQVTDGSRDSLPSVFEHTVSVPGLLTLARPSFVNVAPPVLDRMAINRDTSLFYNQRDSLREVFWYHRSFDISGKIPGVVRLKVGKAMFGTRVYVNGILAGEHLPSFTPGWFDIRKLVKRGKNYLLISVGASRSAVPRDIPDGFDYEKQRYIPGIFDNVELVLSSTPYIRNVQVAPDIEKKTAHVRVVFTGDENNTFSPVKIQISEAGSGAPAGEYSISNMEFRAGGETTIDCDIPVAGCTLWSPENPFLYRIDVTTSGDSYSTRFGMRELHFDPSTQHAVLNGQPYFLRGTNITLYRFFEDPLCDSLPWDYNWVRRMHAKFKNDLFWNSFRNCIGFPPEEWYNIADEMGFMIQDEFPIWYGSPDWNKWVKKLNPDELATEYREWMEERWNHPSVVIWDANNETSLTEPSIDSAIARVRKLDLSGRSWDNSYSTCREEGDIYESHPYHFSDPDFKLKDIARAEIVPQGNNMKNPGTYPVIINEYGWLWLNRDGSPTTLTTKLYENLLGKNSTPEQRWELYARYMAAETEFWRCHRRAAGVLHFTALGYGRPDGQTCDHWTDLPNLVWEPNFLKYMRNAFAPLGIMADFWDDTIRKGTDRKIPVVMINDLGREWKGKVLFRIIRDESVVLEKSEDVTLPGYGRSEASFSTGRDLPSGSYTLEVALADTPFGTIRSVRRFRI